MILGQVTCACGRTYEIDATQTNADPIPNPNPNPQPQPNPSPAPGGTPGAYTELPFPMGSQDKEDGLFAGAYLDYMFTVPDGVSTFSMNVSSISQNCPLDLIVVKAPVAPTDSEMAQYWADAMAYYSANMAALLNTPYFKTYANGAVVWMTMKNDNAGASCYMKQAATGDGYGATASIPGVYYSRVVAGAQGNPNYYVYVKQ